jgi:acyl-CoA dehydrogenase
MKEDVLQAAGFQAQWIGGAGFRIAGGTNKVLRNIVAERVLGMPADVRVDKNKMAYGRIAPAKVTVSSRA